VRDTTHCVPTARRVVKKTFFYQHVIPDGIRFKLLMFIQLFINPEIGTSSGGYGVFRCAKLKP
ncbi:MAG: hypothetical protein FWF54_08290, partial [Candidatus Azobacteroides sp.]|nr:hypothetical protein [Candidatus Azobacteroides sp.]